MFCPGCGTKEDRLVQFCRACGIDLRAVRSTIEQPDPIAASAIAAREEVARAVAARIRETDELRQLEDVLPELEKFLESPQERRLRRLRTGVIISAIGLGATLFFFLLSLAEKDIFFATGLGVITFLIGLGIIINGLAFTVPKQNPADRSPDDRHGLSLSSATGAQVISPPAPSSTQAPTVTEQTTRHLSNGLTK